MPDPCLYQMYDRHEAVEFFGEDSDSKLLCDGQWVILPGVILGFAQVGEPPRMSHFTNGNEFCWVADKPYRVSDMPHAEFFPWEVVRSQGESNPIHLFVRNDDSTGFRYIGQLERTSRWGRSGRDSDGEVLFPLTPTLPSKVWVELGGLRLGDLDHHAIDAALARLRGPLTVEERLQVLQRLVEYWHGPIRPEDGIAEHELVGRAIPHPLRWWYEWAGRRRAIMSGQNELLDPERLSVNDNLLEFYVENQYCYQWGTLIEGEDPPVFGRAETSDAWEPEGITLSEHLILACLFEAVTHCPYGASISWLETSVLARIVEQIPPIAINPWRWGDASRFHAKGGAFMLAMPNGEIDDKPGYSVWIGAKTEHPVQFVRQFIDSRWEHVAI